MQCIYRQDQEKMQFSCIWYARHEVTILCILRGPDHLLCIVQSTAHCSETMSHNLEMAGTQSALHLHHLEQTTAEHKALRLVCLEGSSAVAVPETSPTSPLHQTSQGRQAAAGLGCLEGKSGAQWGPEEEGCKMRSDNAKQESRFCMGGLEGQA